ncbi:MAG: GNAT family N-acetyltransferase [Ktedonobacteraceae bacterium]
MERFEVKRVEPHEVEVVHDILRQCGEDMKERFGLTHWIPPYPLHLMRQSAQEKRVYAVFNTGQVIATFTLGTQAPSYYAELGDIWESGQARALFLNRLAVLPPMRGQGIGSWCLAHIEQLANEEQYEAIRFDAYARHRKLLEFYQKAGYRQKGFFVVSTPSRGENEIVCFEKIL